MKKSVSLRYCFNLKSFFSMTIEIADPIMERVGISAADVLMRIALSLFQEERVTLGQAAQIAGLHQIQFQLELSKRNIPIHYGEAEYLHDLAFIQTI
jgi:predicted HTH domain antitoxin